MILLILVIGAVVSHTWILLYVTLTFSLESDMEGERSDNWQSKLVLALKGSTYPDEEISFMHEESKFKHMEQMYENLSAWV